METAGIHVDLYAWKSRGNWNLGLDELFERDALC